MKFTEAAVEAAAQALWQVQPLTRENVRAAARRALEAASPRTITTLEELDALPLEAIVRDGDKEPWERTNNGWRCWVYGEAFPSRDLILPATVLHEPKAEATR